MFSFMKTVPDLNNNTTDESITCSYLLQAYYTSLPNIPLVMYFWSKIVQRRHILWWPNVWADLHACPELGELPVQAGLLVPQ